MALEDKKVELTKPKGDDRPKYQLTFSKPFLNYLKANKDSAYLDVNNLILKVEDKSYRLQDKRSRWNTERIYKLEGNKAVSIDKVVTLVVDEEPIVFNKKSNKKKQNSKNLTRVIKENVISCQSEHRRKIIHRLALMPCDVNTLCSTVSIDKSIIQSILNKVAKEQNGFWILNSENYIEVDVKNWYDYSFEEKKLVAANCWIALRHLGIGMDTEYYLKLKEYLEPVEDKSKIKPSNNKQEKDGIKVSASSAKIKGTTDSINIDKGIRYNFKPPKIQTKKCIELKTIKQFINRSQNKVVKKSSYTTDKDNKIVYQPTPESIVENSVSGLQGKDVVSKQKDTDTKINQQCKGKTIEEGLITDMSDQTKLKRSYQLTYNKQMDIYNQIQAISNTLHIEKALLECSDTNEQHKIIEESEFLRQNNLQSLTKLSNEYKKLNDKLIKLRNQLKED